MGQSCLKCDLCGVRSQSNTCSLPKCSPTFAVILILGIRVVGKGSWKERKVGKFLVEKSKMKLERLKLESWSRSWKNRGEVVK